VIPSGKALQNGNLQRGWSGPPVLEIGARWDSEWYLLIALGGYHLEEQMAGRRVAYEGADATGFFPLYPLLIRETARALEFIPAVRRIGVTPWSPRDSAAVAPGGAALLLAGILISNAALLATILLLRGRILATGETPGVALLSCAALLFFPPSLFLSAVYAESLLLCLSLLCFKFLRDRRWVAAALAGGLASATKPSGMLLILPAVLALAQPASPRSGSEGSSRTQFARWLTLPLYPAGVALFSLYCGREFGDPLSWLHRQDRWRGALSGPWRAIVRWAEHPVIHGSHGSTVELIFAVLSIALLLVALRRRPLAESIYSAAVVIPPLCSTLWSFGRLSLQAFPLFISLGGVLARRRGLAIAYFVVAAVGSALLMAYFGAWYWAG